MNPDTQSHCPKCQTPIPEGAPRGLCPRCLMGQALESEPKVTAPAPPVEELAPCFPQLEILELLGSGGMGRVYKARQVHLDRLVALKILPPELASDAAFAERFTREARALAKLNHPHIVQVFDFGQSAAPSGGSPYFYLLLEFVDGVNLRQAMRAGTLTAREALGIVPRLCDALHYAHEQGVLHRDIKPENILLDTQGRVKIADFGLARFQNGGDTEAMTLTASGARLGTAAYMAPEQIERPHDVDHRADIYSLGVVFYEMLTGELPLGRFAAPSETSGVDPRLDSVVFRTLEKQRERRFQSAGEMRTQVEGIAGSPTPKGAAAAFSSPVTPSSALKESRSAYAFPPECLESTWRWISSQFRHSGYLTLEPERLVFGTSKATLSIPLEAIEETALAPLRWGVDPLGRCLLSLRWRDPTGLLQTTCLLPKSAPTQKAKVEFDATDEWFQAIREAVARKKGQPPGCPHSLHFKAAEVTPLPPEFRLWQWALLGLASFFLAMIGFAMFFLPGVVVVAAASCVVLGLWRRVRDPMPEAGAFSSPGIPLSSPTPMGEPAGPRFSKLALVAFALATIGWAAPIVGPIIGCVLGWIALGQIKRSEGLLRGRALAMFAALEAPVLAGNALLIAGTVGLWEARLMPPAYIVVMLAVAALAFLYNSFLFRLAGFQPRQAWRKLFAPVAVMLAVFLLSATTWAVTDLKDKFPFRGTKAAATLIWRGPADLQTEEAVDSALANMPHADMATISRGDRSSAHIHVVMDRAADARRMIDEICKSIESQMPSHVNLRIASINFEDAPSIGDRRFSGAASFMSRSGFRHRAKWHDGLMAFFIAMSAIGCAGGLLLALSGFGYGLVGFLLGLAACIGLQVAHLPSPFGEAVRVNIERKAT